jgi:hypothetical protein
MMRRKSASAVDPCKQWRIIALLVVVINGLVFDNALAYVDPVSGSVILQILLGGLVGLVVAAKTYWRRIMSILGLGEKRNDDKS